MNFIEPEALPFLQKFHADQPGVSPRTFAHGRLATGQNSYALLAEAWSPTEENLRILDLACGDGFLMELIRRRHRVPIDLVGVDLSPAELARARARLGLEADLRLGAAQHLALPGGSVDHAVCHMALMLMDPVEPVIAAVASVLKPGGTFTAIVNHLRVESPALITFARLVQKFTERDGLAPLVIGDPRTRTVEGLEAVFGAASDLFETPEITEMLLDLGGSAENVHAVLMGFYPPWRLSAACREDLSREMLAEFSAQADEDGRVDLALPLVRVQVSKRLIPLQKSTVS